MVQSELGFRHCRVSRLPFLSMEGLGVRVFLTIKDTKKLAVYHIVVPARLRVPQSYHKVAEEIIVFLKGRGVALINAARRPVRAGDCLWIRPGTHHGFETKSSSLTLLAILSPHVNARRDFYYV